MMQAVVELSLETGRAEACRSLRFPRASFYRKLSPVPSCRPPRKSSRALGERERQSVLDHLHSSEYVDQSPYAAWASLLDQGLYLGSVRTFYRILEAHQEVRERRNQKRHVSYEKPELLAEAPNQVWSWDITKLLGPKKWNYFYLYVLLDIYSRYVVGWMVAERESAFLAKRLIRETCEKQEIEEGQLTLHADRGPSMRSKLVAQLLADLSVTKTHSRPYTSTDNPFSEAHFKTLKYRPEFPTRFGSLLDARTHCRHFFRWYNQEHYHSGLGFLTPHSVHDGTATKVLEKRTAVLRQAYERYPERFVKGQPRAPKLPEAVWINPPKEKKGNKIG